MSRLRIVLMLLAVFMLTGASAALSMPFQMSQPIDLSASSACNPVNMFSSVPKITSMISGFPADGSFFQSGTQDSMADNTHGIAASPLFSTDLFSFPVSNNKSLTIPQLLGSSSTQVVSNNFPNPAEPETTDQATRLNVQQAQKDEAVKVAASSPLCKQYNVYPNESWGCEWVETFPSFNNHELEVYSPVGTFYGCTLVITVDLSTDTIVKSELKSNSL